MLSSFFVFFFFFNDTATTEIYTLSLHDALPIYTSGRRLQAPEVRCQNHPVPGFARVSRGSPAATSAGTASDTSARSEEHTSELQSQSNLVCRLLLEKKKKINTYVSCHVSETSCT